MLVCDDSDLAIAAARRSRFYGICVNSVSQASVARNIVHRYPFAAIAVAGSFGSASHGLVRELRAAAPRVPIVVVGAAGADAHRALLRAGADRILPSGVEPERLIAVCGEIIHEGQPSIGTVLPCPNTSSLGGTLRTVTRSLPHSRLARSIHPV